MVRKSQAESAMTDIENAHGERLAAKGVQRALKGVGIGPGPVLPGGGPLRANARTDSDDQGGDDPAMPEQSSKRGSLSVRWSRGLAWNTRANPASLSRRGGARLKRAIGPNGGSPDAHLVRSCCRDVTLCSPEGEIGLVRWVLYALTEQDIPCGGLRGGNLAREQANPHPEEDCDDSCETEGCSLSSFPHSVGSSDL
jgi:hypothetical protein